MPALALGLDPGFASIGVAVVELAHPMMRVVALRVLRTAKSKVRKAADDNLQRTLEISAALFGLLEEYPDIRVICAESMSYPPNAAAAAKMSMCWGVIGALAERKDLALVQYGPQEIKKLVCGNKSASKEEVQQAVCRFFPGQSLAELHQGTPRSLEEHLYDAAAAVVAANSSTEFKLLRTMMRASKEE